MTDEAYKTVIPHLADLHNYVGKELGLSDWMTITQNDIDVFAKLTGDEQWIHVDPVRAARESPFGTTVACEWPEHFPSAKFCLYC